MHSITELNCDEKLDPIMAKWDFIFSALSVPGIHGIIRDVWPDEKGVTEYKQELSARSEQQLRIIVKYAIYMR